MPVKKSVKKPVAAKAKSKPAKLFILAGYHDLAAGKKPDEVYREYVEFLSGINLNT